VINKLYSPRIIFLILCALIIFAVVQACAARPVTEPSIPSSVGNTSQPVVVETVWPLLTQVVSMPTYPPPTIVPEPPTAQPAIDESRRLTLEFPPKLRAGVEGGIVRLTLEVDNLGNITPTAKFEGNEIVGETLLVPDLYETHYVTAEARLDMAGMLVQPSEATYEPLKRGHSVTFYWSVRPQESGIYRGTVWLYLNFTNKSTGEESRIAISAQIIEIEAVDLFGLRANVVRISGLIGTVIAGVVGFPFMEDFIKLVFKGRKRMK
jgi:hypothetical protein